MVPHEQRAARVAKRWRSQGHSLPAIRLLLAYWGHVPRGQSWTQQAVERLLRVRNYHNHQVGRRC